MKLSAWPEHRTLIHRLSPAGCSKMQLNSPGLRTVDSMPCNHSLIDFRKAAMWHGWNFSIAQNLVFSSPWLVQKSHIDHIDHIDHMVATNMQLPPAFEGPDSSPNPSLLPLTLPSLWAPRVSSEPLRSQPGPGVPPMDGTSSSCWMTDDGWVNWAQLGSTGVNLQKPQLKSVDFPVLSRKPLERWEPGSAGYRCARCARCAPCSAQKRNQGNPAQSWGTQYDSVTMRTPKWAETAPTSTCTSRCNDSADNNTWVNSSAMDFTTEPLLIKLRGAFQFSMFQVWYSIFHVFVFSWNVHLKWVWVKIRYPNNWMVNTKLD